MEDRILAASYREFSPADIKFLEAMVLDKHDSAIADITARLGWASSQVGQYRRRLIKAGAIGERARGIVGFDMPYLKDYVARRLGEANHG